MQQIALRSSSEKRSTDSESLFETRVFLLVIRYVTKFDIDTDKKDRLRNVITVVGKSRLLKRLGLRFLTLTLCNPRG